jgi:hypothetical protein
MTPTDHINQQAVASYVQEAIWPGNKILPKSSSKCRDDKRSLCQMILKKVAPLGVVCECSTAGCKAFSLANGKGMGTNDWVIKSLDD